LVEERKLRNHEMLALTQLCALGQMPELCEAGSLSSN
jgi:hypothetical protein